MLNALGAGLVDLIDMLAGPKRLSYRRGLAFVTVITISTWLAINGTLTVEWIGCAVTMAAMYIGGDTVEKFLPVLEKLVQLKNGITGQTTISKPVEEA